jgi:hypothetical protein
MNWIGKGITIMLMFVLPPISLTELVLPNLSKIDTTNFSGLPAVILVAFYLAWIVDYGGAFALMRDWTKNSN